MRKLTLLSLILISPIVCQSAWASPASDEAEVGNSLARQGCYDSALMFYDKALRLSPNYAPAIDARNRVLSLMGKAGADKGKKGKKKGDQADSTDTAKAKAEKPGSPIAKIKPPEKVKPSVAVTPPVKPVTPPAKPKPPVVATVKTPPAVKPVTPPKPTAVAVVKPVPPPKPVTIKPIAKPAPPVAAATVKPVTAMASPLKPIVPTPAVPISVVKQKPAPAQQPIEPVKVEPEDDQAAPVSEDTTPRSTAPVEDLRSVPPTSGDSSFSDTIDSRAPSWLFYMAGGTFLLLLALGVWWLSPTLSASRQLHDRLKGLEQRKER